MTKKDVKNLGASVKTKLMFISKEKRIDFNSILIQYFHERFWHGSNKGNKIIAVKSCFC